MADHPIQGLMKTAMESIREMVDVNTIVGDPVETQDGSVILPVSRVSFGFAAGGAEYGLPVRRQDRQAGAGGDEQGTGLPFGGGSGAGVTLRPMGFLVVGQGQVRLLPVDGRALYDRLIDLAPQLIQEIQAAIRGDGRGYERGAAAPAPEGPTGGRRLRARPGV
ncbi:MAG: GerW family sporulation protein [Firmicutes bacterium]|nr:GerW family sporulation protein [Bacillota bacterium]